MRTFACFLLLPVLAAQPAVVAIRGARVVDGTGAPARAATVIVRHGRIESVGAGIKIPGGAHVVEAGGRTLIPGLFDLHTHLNASAVTGLSADWGKNLKAYLACGVTSVNDFSVSGEMFAPLRRLLAAGLPAPRVNLASRISTPAGHGTEGGWGDFMTLEASTPEQGHWAMKSVLEYHPDVIKVFTDGWRYDTAPNLTGMNLETLAAIVEDAHAAGIKVLTHTVTLAGAKIAARAGVDVIAHGIGDAPVDQELIDILKAKKTTYAPTLAVYERHRPQQASRAMRLLDPEARAILADGGGWRTVDTTTAAARDRRWRYLLDNVRRLHEAGIPIGTGTDAGMPATYHGDATLRELELLVEAGLKPIEAVTAATNVSAHALGVDRERGTIAPGKIADLVLIDGRPDLRIEEIEKTDRVFLAGAALDPLELEAAIQTNGATPFTAREIAPAIDDMEHGDRTLLGTLRVNSTDAGTDHSRMMFLPVVRDGSDHALLIEARMAARERPYVRLEIPLTPGAVESADLSRYSGVSFEARGEGDFRLEMLNYGARRGDRAGAAFAASGAWQVVRIPFAAVPAWNPKEVRALLFRLAGPPGAGVWLELDNIRLY